MNNKRSYDMVIGSFVALGLVVLVVLIFLIGKERRLFDRTVKIKAHFPNVAGLALGADVLLSGRVVGKVKAIEFPLLDIKNHNKDMTVVMEISHEYAHWIRSDSIAYIDSKGLLGDKLLNISMGSALFAELEEGGMLISNPPLDFAATMANAKEALNAITDLVKDLNQDLKKEGGVNSLAASFRTVQKILQEIESGQGILHDLIYDQKLAHTAKEAIDKAKDSLVSITKTSDELTSLLKDIKTGSGIAHDLIYTDNQGQLLSSLNRAAIDLETIIKDLKNGKGSLGLLLKDPGIYEELHKLMGDVNRNRLFKAVVRHSISKAKP